MAKVLGLNSADQLIAEEQQKQTVNSHQARILISVRGSIGSQRCEAVMNRSKNRKKKSPKSVETLQISQLNTGSQPIPEQIPSENFDWRSWDQLTRSCQKLR